jgi:hypothetical protein
VVVSKCWRFQEQQAHPGRACRLLALLPLLVCLLYHGAAVLWALALAFKTLPCKMEMGCFVPSIQKHRQQVFNYYTLINTTNPPTMLARQRQGAHKQTGS